MGKHEHKFIPATVREITGLESEDVPGMICQTCGETRIAEVYTKLM